MLNTNELNEHLISLNKLENQLFIKISLQQSYDVVEWEQELIKIAQLDDIESLDIDCSIAFVELESQALIGFLNNILIILAKNLTSIAIEFTIKDCQIPEKTSDDEAFDNNMIADRDRWMSSLSNLQEGFKLLCSLNHFSFIFSLDDEIFDKFYQEVSDMYFLEVYSFDPIVDLLKAQSIYRTLKSIYLNLEYVDYLNKAKAMELLNVFSENESLESLEIISQDGFYLSFPKNDLKYSIKDLKLTYNNCIYDIDSLDNIRNIVSQFPLLKLKLHISSIDSNDTIKKELRALNALRRDILYHPSLRDITLTGNNFDMLPKISEQRATKRSYAGFHDYKPEESKDLMESVESAFKKR